MSCSDWREMEKRVSFLIVKSTLGVTSTQDAMKIIKCLEMLFDPLLLKIVMYIIDIFL